LLPTSKCPRRSPAFGEGHVALRLATPRGPRRIRTRDGLGRVLNLLSSAGYATTAFDCTE
jgi:hypothetical protein